MIGNRDMESEYRRRMGQATVDHIQSECISRALIFKTTSPKEGDVVFVLMKEVIDTGTFAGKLLFTLMSATAQFERDVIADRTREGLKSARARRRIGGRPRANAENVKKVLALFAFKQLRK